MAFSPPLQAGNYRMTTTTAKAKKVSKKSTKFFNVGEGRRGC